MNEYINFYTNNPTKGGTNGTLVSIHPSEASPITMVLDASKNESKASKVALRCQEGYYALPEAVVSFTGDTASTQKWQIALDDNYSDADDALANANWVYRITIPDKIETTNYIFWVKATSAISELPGHDIGANIWVHAVVAPVLVNDDDSSEDEPTP